MYKRGVQCCNVSACIGFRELKPMLNEMIHIVALQLCELAHFVDCIRMDTCDLIFKVYSQEDNFYHVVCKIENFKVSQGIQTFHNFYCILRMHNSTQLLNFLVHP